MNKKIVLSFFICFFGTLTFAKSLDSLTELDLDKELKSFKSLNVFDGPINKNKLSSLAKVKLHQVERKFLDCQKSGINLIASSEVKEWLATVILQCSLAAVDGKKSSSDLKKAVDVIYKLKLESGPWKSSFGDVWSLSHVRLFDDSSSIDSKAKVLDSWAKPWDLLSKEQQAAWLQAKADLMIAQKKNAKAAFFLKQSQDLFPSKNFNDKIQSLLGLKAESVGKSVSPVESVTAAEQKMDEEIQKLLSSSRTLPAQKLMVDSLKQFPQGKQVKKYKDKILDIYFSQNKEKQEEALNNLLSAPEDRLLE